MIHVLRRAEAHASNSFTPSSSSKFKQPSSNQSTDDRAAVKSNMAVGRSGSSHVNSILVLEGLRSRLFSGVKEVSQSGDDGQAPMQRLLNPSGLAYQMPLSGS